MKLSEIEVTVPVGRTERGKTITVKDLLNAFAVVSGTRLGSQEFDRALGSPMQMHAPETMDNAARYRTLRAVLERSCASGPQEFRVEHHVGFSHVSAEESSPVESAGLVHVRLEFERPEGAGLGLDEALDKLQEKH